MKKLFIHAGFHKTATTYIQHFLETNQQILEPYILYYMDAAYRETAYSNHTLAASIRHTTHPEINIAEPKDAVWKRFLDAIETSTRDSILVSSEVFMENVDLAFLRRILESFDLTFLFYVRRQDEYFESIYAETILHGHSHSATEFYEAWKSRGLDYASRILSFEQAVPDARIIVREFNRNLFPKGDIIRDLLGAIGVVLPDAKWDELRPIGVLNPRLPREYVDLMRKFNCLPVSYEEKMAFRNHLLGLRAREPAIAQLPPLQVDANLRHEILEFSRKSNLNLVERYLRDGEFFSIPTKY